MLTNEEKKLVRQALCDGVFNLPGNPNVPVGQNRNTNPMGRAIAPLTPDVLERVANMFEEEVRARLVLYKSSKVAQINQQIKSIDAQKVKLTEILSSLQ